MEKKRGEGWGRMMTAFGPDAFEKLRQDTIHLQKIALANAKLPTKEKADKSRDRPKPRKSGQYPPVTRKEI